MSRSDTGPGGSQPSAGFTIRSSRDNAPHQPYQPHPPHQGQHLGLRTEAQPGQQSGHQFGQPPGAPQGHLPASATGQSPSGPPSTPQPYNSPTRRPSSPSSPLAAGQSPQGGGQLTHSQFAPASATGGTGHSAGLTGGTAITATAPPAPAGNGLLGLGSAPRKLSGRRRRETVAVLIFGGAPIFESSIPLSVFGVDRQDAGVPRYRLLVCAGEDGPLATTGGLTLTAPFGLEALARAGTIVVPAWRSISQPPPPEAIAALRKAHHEGARIIGLCTGAFVLAAAGLLDGRPATTHWMYAPTLAKRYPKVHVDPRELFVDDGDVLTSAGTAAGIDLCLHVVRSDHGAEAANALARRLVVPNRRSGGGQAQYIDQSLPEEIGNDPLAEVVTWALENLNQQFDVEVLAARAYMSRRTFDRRFRTLTGSAPLQWLITQRVLQAQRLLEASELSVDDVARRCGFRSPVALRGHFRRQLGVSPAAYRTSYRARRPSPAGGAGLAGPGSAAPTVPQQAHPADRSALAPHGAPHGTPHGGAPHAGAPAAHLTNGPLRPLVPTQGGQGAVQHGHGHPRPGARPHGQAASGVEHAHATATEEGYGPPTARDLAQGHRPDGTPPSGSHAHADRSYQDHPDHVQHAERPATGNGTDPAPGRQLSGSRDRAVG